VFVVGCCWLLLVVGVCWWSLVVVGGRWWSWKVVEGRGRSWKVARFLVQDYGCKQKRPGIGFSTFSQVRLITGEYDGHHEVFCRILHFVVVGQIVPLPELKVDSNPFGGTYLPNGSSTLASKLSKFPNKARSGTKEYN
jgi:hypothetical protein